MHSFKKDMKSYILQQLSLWGDKEHYDNTAVTYHIGHFEGILPKGPYLPCVSMVGKALFGRMPSIY